MDTPRLTPKLRRRCLSLSVGERMSLASSLTESIGVDRSAIPGRYIAVMSALVGEPICSKSRRAELVRGRAVVAFALRAAGFSTIETGQALGRDHSSITHLVKTMEMVLSHPAMYPEAFALYEQFLNTIV